VNAGAPTSFFECRALSEREAPALAELFARAGSDCHCEWWHFEGDKNAWLARLAHAPEANREALFERARGSGLSGVIAVTRPGEVVGWMKLTAASDVAKLYAQRPYRGLPTLKESRPGTMTIGCFLVDPTWRRRGVAASLLATGLELARAAGAPAVEAFPRRAEALRDEELWTGPYGLLSRHGFEVIHELAQYPVLRRML
jgi:GNAT superfamily N-acetyltransferase